MVGFLIRSGEHLVATNDGVSRAEPGPEVRSCEPRARTATPALKSSFRALVRPLVARNQILFNILKQNIPFNEL